MTKPNFFIVGAPKCGTTAFYHYLKQHPNVFLSIIKEPCYFASDFSHRQWAKDLQSYLTLFDDAGPDHLILGEASVVYLRSQVALHNIRDFNPDARILVMLRNPVDLAHAFHMEMYYHFNEDVADFETAWRLQLIRERGEKLPSLLEHPNLIQYRKVAMLGDQVEKLYSIFPNEQIKVVLLEDFIADQRKVWLEMLDFLGLPDDGRTEFPYINDSHRWKSAPLGRLLIRPPEPLRYIWRRLKPILGLNHNPVVKKLQSWNTGKSRRLPLSKEFRAELNQVFQPDVEKLSRIIDRDLSHWSKP